jgi:predicted XRE-type DNA-binding protein
MITIEQFLEEEKQEIELRKELKQKILKLITRYNQKDIAKLLKVDNNIITRIKNNHKFKISTIKHYLK